MYSSEDGTRYKLIGLVTATELNGSECMILRYHADRERYEVQLLHPKRRVQVKHANLAPCAYEQGQVDPQEALSLVRAIDEKGILVLMEDGKPVAVGFVWRDGLPGPAPERTEIWHARISECEKDSPNTHMHVFASGTSLYVACQRTPTGMHFNVEVIYDLKTKWYAQLHEPVIAYVLKRLWTAIRLHG